MSAPDRERYDPTAIEPKWQAYWDEHHTFRAERHAGRGKKYILDMFPYPSGSGLHVGHPEGYTATDIVSRYWRMRGLDVLHPMGWDAFGLPAEQHAIDTGTHPRATTQKNIATFKRQLKMLGFSYDWAREVDTTDPGYVRWTQWIFLQLFKKGLAYQDKVAVNWCPALGTVLANEEVVDGKSERGGHPVERLPLRQWMLRITEYADRLDADLGPLDWPETKGKQHHWIGRSEGAEVDFGVQGGGEGGTGTIRVFTTRVDTLSGATYVVLAPEHPLAATVATPEQRSAVLAYIEAARGKSDIDRSDVTRAKTGVATGARAVNPLTGHAIPIWVGDYVIGSYGTGAVMAVPAHDERDHAFAKAYGLPIVQVVAPAGGASTSASVDVRATAFVEDGVAKGVTGQVSIADGTPSEEVRRLTIAWLTEHEAGAPRVTYRLRDWVFSRQRYWGEPIPVYFPVECAGDPRVPGTELTVRYDRPIAVDESELPLKLPDLEDFRPGNDPAGPLARVPEWRFFQKGDAWFARETNTMPQWAGSCWYYLRFLDPNETSAPWTPEAYADWMPVDLYVGGSEHAVLHLLYARFWHKVLFDLGLVKDSEPFVKLVHQGMILGELEHLAFRDAAGNAVGAEHAKEDGEGAWVNARTGEPLTVARVGEDDVEKKGLFFVLKAEPTVRVSSRSYKMSKSRGNVVNPDDVVRSHGADTLRVYEMFMGPLEATKPWQTANIEGARRFLDRVFFACTGPLTESTDDETRQLVARTVKKVGEDIEGLRFNTAISAMMILVRHLGGLTEVPREAARTLALLVSPFAPHLGEELWHRLGATASLVNAPWPSFDPALVKEAMVEIGVQVNGKLRGVLQLAVDANQETALAAARAVPGVETFLAGKTVKKVVYVAGKILNIVVG